MKKNQTQIKKYAAVISIFLAAVIVGLFVFFFCIKRSVEQRSKNTMRNNVVRQSEHLRTILDIQYDYLNGLTEEIGKTDHLLAKKNMDLIKSITKHTDFGGTALIEPNGDAHYDNGLIKNLSHRRYFKEVISGKRTLSDPLDSSISGSTRVVLGVPIYNSKHKVIGALAEAVKAQSSDEKQWNRLKEIFTSKSLQMVSFTITEKGYALQKADGTWFPFVEADIKNGPDKAAGAMAVLVAMLYERYKAGEYPIALVSMDNCSQNGAKLRESVLTMTEEWKKAGFVDEGFVNYVSDEKVVAFPWTMIDKITPRPSEQIAADLEKLGVENMQPVITGKKTYIAPFVNAEKPQYLVIEDSFPNGRPALEKGFGVYMADRNTVNLSERMKVTVCLNPVHSATGPLGVVLGYDLFAHMLNTNEDMMKMARMIAYDEGLPVVADPGILSPQAFVDELFNDRFPNEYLGDTNLRLAVDVSQMVGIRFGETVKAYVKRFGNASKLTAIPLGIAGWLRYMLAVDDAGNKYELAPDPMNEELQEQFKDIVVGKPETFKDQLKPILSNERLFFTDLYKDGVGEKIEDMFREMIAGPGAVRETIHKYVG